MPTACRLSRTETLSCEFASRSETMMRYNLLGGPLHSRQTERAASFRDLPRNPLRRKIAKTNRRSPIIPSAYAIRSPPQWNEVFGTHSYPFGARRARACDGVRAATFTPSPKKFSPSVITCRARHLGESGLPDDFWRSDDHPCLGLARLRRAVRHECAAPPRAGYLCSSRGMSDLRSGLICGRPPLLRDFQRQ
jgi:hypothetical protein